MSANTWLSLVVVVFWLGLGIAIRASRSTTSIFPVIPLVPGVLWLVGVVVNHFASPWGTVVVGAIHYVHPRSAQYLRAPRKQFPIS